MRKRATTETKRVKKKLMNSKQTNAGEAGLGAKPNKVKLQVIVQVDQDGGHKAYIGRCPETQDKNFVSKRFASLENCKYDVEVWINDNTNFQVSNLEFVLNHIVRHAFPKGRW